MREHARLATEPTAAPDQDGQRNFISSSAASSSAAVAVEKTKADERALTPEALAPARARDILIGQIKPRILDREDLITRLQQKIEAIAEKERQERAVYFNPENKARHGGRRI